MGRVLGFLAVFLAVFGIGMWATGAFGPRTGDGTSAGAEDSADGGADADADQPLRTGLWTIRRSIEVIDMPGAAPNLLSQVRQEIAETNRDSGTRKSCLLDRNLTRMFSEAIGPEFACRVTGDEADGGELDGRVMCLIDWSSEKQAGTMAGRVDGKSWNATIDLTDDLVNSRIAFFQNGRTRLGPVKVRITSVGEHVSDDCGPEMTELARKAIATWGNL